MKQHELKTWPSSFDAVWRGTKGYELRNDDRGFAIGDLLVLHEWVPIHEQPCRWDSLSAEQAEHSDLRCTICDRGMNEPLDGMFTGRQIRAEVTFKTSADGPHRGLKEGFAILGIAVRQKRQNDMIWNLEKR